MRFYLRLPPPPQFGKLFVWPETCGIFGHLLFVKRDLVILTIFHYRPGIKHTLSTAYYLCSYFCLYSHSLLYIYSVSNTILLLFAFVRLIVFYFTSYFYSILLLVKFVQFIVCILLLLNSTSVYIRGA